jgi:hypothetical protein
VTKKNFFLTVSLIILTLISCGTKTVAYFDIDTSEIIGNGNKIMLDSNLSPFGALMLYSSNNSNKYKGIEFSLSLTSDTLISIGDLQLYIRHSKNVQSIKPISFLLSDITTLKTINGADFLSVKKQLNNTKDKTISIFFEVDVEKYDSLFAHIIIKYSRLSRNYFIDKDITYKKGYYYAPLSR